jgi:hypothetical protein
MQIWPEKVDWEAFRQNFPSLDGGWFKPMNYDFQRDDDGMNAGWGFMYPLLEPHLSPKVRKGLGLLTAATSTVGADGVDLEKYETKEEYDPEAFFEAGVFLPELSPQQVAKVMKAFRAVPKEELVKEIRAAWPKIDFSSDPSLRVHFPKVDDYLVYLDEWEQVMDEIDREGCGFAFGVG